MDLDHALLVFRLYCRLYRQNPSEAEALLLTDKEKQIIQELKELTAEHADLFRKQST